MPEVVEISEDFLLFAGGLTPDLVAWDADHRAVYIVECKGSVNVTGVVQGIGQAYEYLYQKDLNRKTRTGKIALALPQEIRGELAYLDIPKRINVLLVDEKGRVFTEDRGKARAKPSPELHLPETVYLRDLEINHIATILKVINELSPKSRGYLPQKKIKSAVKKANPKIAAEGYNHFITLRGLGLIDYENRLSSKGLTALKMSETSEARFQQEMCAALYCFILNVINGIILVAAEKQVPLNNIPVSNKEIANAICKAWGEKVRFLNDGRTTGTVSRILLELGVIKRVPGGRIALQKLVHPDFLPW